VFAYLGRGDGNSQGLPSLYDGHVFSSRPEVTLFKGSTWTKLGWMSTDGILYLLLKDSPAWTVTPEIVHDDERSAGRRIRCPRCGWEPGRDDLWMCTCFHAWNTFDTGGVCPACSRRWTETQCLRCGQWSLHVRWYQGED
jgi:hypothetical protein